MSKKVVVDLCREVSYEELQQINGGIAPAIIAALIGAGVTILGGAIAMDMQNASERGKNDAYNDMYHGIPTDLGTPLYRC